MRNRMLRIAEKESDSILATQATEVGRSRSAHQIRVDLFMLKADQAMPERPTMLSEADRILRAKLILEEAFETIEKGLGLRVTRDTFVRVDVIQNLPIDFDDLRFIQVREPNMLELVDGCLDLRVVTTGTLSAAGVSDLIPQRLVDVANLAKFGPGGYRREDGKWMKPPDWEPPALAQELKGQGWEEGQDAAPPDDRQA